MLREHIPALWRHVGKKAPIWHLLYSHYMFAHACLLSICRVQRLLPPSVMKFFTLATQMDSLLSDVRYDVFWSSLSCTVPEWSRPSRRLLLSTAAEWQGLELEKHSF